MTVLFIIRTVLAAVLLIVAAILDNKTMRIPNAITFPAMGIGLLLTYLESANDGMIALIAIVILFIIGMTGFLGMGDLKLLMAVVAFSGYVAGIYTLVGAAICVAAIYLKTALKFSYTLDFKRLFNKEARAGGRKIAFAKYMLVGYIIFVFSNILTPSFFGI